MTGQHNGAISPAEVLRHVQAIGAELLRRGGSPELHEAWTQALDQLVQVLAQRRPNGNGTAHPPEPVPLTGDRLLYRELFEFAPEAHLLTDRTGVIHNANYAAVSLLGTRKDFLCGKPLACFVAQADWLLFYSTLAQLLRHGLTELVREWPLRIQPVHGEPREMMVHVALFRGGPDQNTELRWHLRPLSDREEVERRLRREQHFSDSVLEIAQTLILVVNSRGTILRANQAYGTAVGCNADALEGRLWWSDMPPADQQRLQTLLLRSLQFGTTERSIVRLMPEDQPPRTIVWGVKSLVAEPTAPATLLAVGHDITELEAAQRQALQAARLAAIGKVTTTLAHEARNMLQRIQGGLDRLAWRLEDRPEALEIVAGVRQAQQDLTHLFDDVRSYAAPIRLERALCSLTEVWREAWEQALAGAGSAANEARLSELGCNATDTTCWGDRFRLVQVFRNIFENALAAAPAPAEIRVVCLDTLLDQTPALAVAVRDNGPGLNAEQRQNIFEPFYTTKPRGTGLGLAIARRVIEAHGGHIGIGEAGAGAEIVVTLPRSCSR